jgi:hypothetical protein
MGLNPSMVARMIVVALLQSCASAGQGQLRAGEERDKLRRAMQVSVDSRARRDQQSQLLADSAQRADLETMNRDSVRAAFGAGRACGLEICRKQGFSDSDWYYEIGVIGGEQVKQLPLLMLSFDPHGHVKRVFTLTTH